MVAKSHKTTEARIISDDELRSSIAKFGCFLPVLRWHGRTLDGHRREIIAVTVGREAPILEVDTRREAASALWIVHPDRALCSFPEPTIESAADLYGTTPEQVAIVQGRLQPHKQPYQKGRMPWHRRRSADLIPSQSDGRALSVRFRISPELREAMRVARTQGDDRCSESAFIRRAIAAACSYRQ